MTSRELKRLPFSTPLQSKAQKVIKDLWDEQEPFLETFAQSWLNQNTFMGTFDEVAMLLYHDVREENDKTIYSFDEDNVNKKNINIDVSYCSDFSPISNEKNIRAIGIKDDDLIGVSLLTIANILHPYYQELSKLHQNILEISETNLSCNTKKYFIRRAVDDVEDYLNRHSFELSFTYPAELLKDLNNLYLTIDWIDDGDSFVIQLILEAYQRIEYYNQWVLKHKIDEKKFKDKILKIKRDYREVINYLEIRPSYDFGNIPEHPQNILHGLVSSFDDFYGVEKKLDDDGVQIIIKLISNYLRMPKKSKEIKALEAFQKETDVLVSNLKNNGATKEEILSFIIERNFGKNIKKR